MKVLYIGDIMARSGRKVAAEVLPKLKKEYDINIVVAQAENVSHGVAMSKKHFKELSDLGIDFFTGGNHSIARNETLRLLNDENEPVIAPANMPEMSKPGYKLLETKFGKIAFFSILGSTFPKGMANNVENPLKCADRIVGEISKLNVAMTVVNFHGDVSSEKRIIGYYLDGRVTAVVGDHWHVPSADAMVLPKGTAHISDVGMCGSLHSSLGVTLDVVIPRWRDGKRNSNVLDNTSPYQFNSVLIDIDEATGLSRSINQIQKIVDSTL